MDYGKKCDPLHTKLSSVSMVRTTLTLNCGLCKLKKIIKIHMCESGSVVVCVIHRSLLDFTPHW
jgi:hypothetical protein